MARRTLYLPVLIVAAVLMGCAPAVLAVSGKAEAAFPGKNGKIAYVRNDGNDYVIYAIDGGGGDKTQLTNDNTGSYVPSYSPGGKKIAYSGSSSSGDTEIYTIDAGGGGVRFNSPTTTPTSSTPTIHLTARGSPTRASTENTTNQRSTRSAFAEEVSQESRRAPILPTRPTARRSPTLCTKDPLPVSTRSMSTEGASSASPPALSTRSLLPGGVVRSDFSCGRWAIGLEV